nr:hypothetical protein CFP56_07416 [Quercus suber]
MEFRLHFQPVDLTRRPVELARLHFTSNGEIQSFGTCCGPDVGRLTTHCLQGRHRHDKARYTIHTVRRACTDRRNWEVWAKG